MIGQSVSFVQSTLFAPPPDTTTSQSSTTVVAATASASSASNSLSSGGASNGEFGDTTTTASGEASQITKASAGREDLGGLADKRLPVSLSGPAPAFVVSELEATLSEQARRISAEETGEATIDRKVADTVALSVEDDAEAENLQVEIKTEPKSAETRDATNGFSQASRLSEPYQSVIMDVKT